MVAIAGVHFKAGAPEAERVDDPVLLGLEPCDQRHKLLHGRSVSLVASAVPLDSPVGLAVHVHDLAESEKGLDVRLVPAAVEGSVGHEADTRPEQQRHCRVPHVHAVSKVLAAPSACGEPQTVPDAVPVKMEEP